MSMKANILRDSVGNITVHMEGDLHFDHSLPLKNELECLIKDNPNTKITIDIGAIDFVGSSGICHFVETIKYLKEKKCESLMLSNVKTEFRRLFKLYSINEADFIAEIFDFDNDETDNLSQRFANREKTYEN